MPTGTHTDALWRYTLQVQGSGFMYKQVRHMTGALLSVGQGKLQLSFLQKLLDIGNSLPPGMWVWGEIWGRVGLCECVRVLVVCMQACVWVCTQVCGVECLKVLVCTSSVHVCL